LEEATHIPLNCYESLVWTKKQLAIFGKGLHNIRSLLKSIGRLDHPKYLSQDDECVKAMTMIPPGEIMGFTLQIYLTKYWQRRGLRPGNIIDIIPIDVTIMSLTLHFQSMDPLQAN
jgi:hypothetical protein